MPSRSALLAMAAPPPEAKPARPATVPPTRRDTRQPARAADETASKQRQVWDSVAVTQRKLSQGLNAAVASPQSASSLQLSLENDKLKEARTAYIAALQPTGEKEADVVGYVVAINGKMSAANLYPSNGLFRKMWSKQLAAVVTEAIGEKPDAAPAAHASAAAPPAVTQFLAEAEKGKSFERQRQRRRQEVRDTDKSLYNEARSADGKWNPPQLSGE